MYLYLAGAMRGIEDHNFPQFFEYAAKLRKAGYQVLSPAESPPPNVMGNPSRSDCLRHDLLVVGVVDGVAVLPNWNDSPGARLEVAAAWAFDIPVYEADGLLAGFGRGGYELNVASVSIPREHGYYEKRVLIGLSGYAGVGKDEVAKTLTSQLTYQRVAFADPLKELATAIGWNGEKDEVGRKFLQDLGVGVREHLNTDAWVLAAEERIEQIDGPVVVTDVRFPNEVQMIRRRGGKVVRVVRPGCGPVNAHISEHLVGDDDCDLIFLNDGTLDELPRKVEEFFDPISDDALVAA